MNAVPNIMNIVPNKMVPLHLTRNSFQAALLKTGKKSKYGLNSVNAN